MSPERREDTPTPLRRALPDAIFDDLSRWLWMGRSVGHDLQPVLTKAAWEVWTFAPAYISDELLARYKSGHPLWDGAAPCWATALDYLVTSIAQEDATLVVPDGMARPSDPSLRRYSSPTEILTAEDELYWIVRRPDADAVDRAWSDAASAAGVIGLMTEAPVPSGQATRNDLAEIAREARLVVFGAYDHPERVIFFSPRG